MKMIHKIFSLAIPLPLLFTGFVATANMDSEIQSLLARLQATQAPNSTLNERRMDLITRFNPQSQAYIFKDFPSLAPAPKAQVELAVEVYDSLVKDLTTETPTWHSEFHKKLSFDVFHSTLFIDRAFVSLFHTLNSSSWLNRRLEPTIVGNGFLRSANAISSQVAIFRDESIDLTKRLNALRLETENSETPLRLSRLEELEKKQSGLLFRLEYFNHKIRTSLKFASDSKANLHRVGDSHTRAENLELLLRELGQGLKSSVQLTKRYSDAKIHGEPIFDVPVESEGRQLSDVPWDVYEILELLPSPLHVAFRRWHSSHSLNWMLARYSDFLFAQYILTAGELIYEAQPEPTWLADIMDRLGEIQDSKLAANTRAALAWTHGRLSHTSSMASKLPRIDTEAVHAEHSAKLDRLWTVFLEAAGLDSSSGVLKCDDLLSAPGWRRP